MKYLSIAVLMAAWVVASPIWAEAGECTLEVDGTTYISGACDYDNLSSSDGSFKIMDLDERYFAYVYVEGTGQATAHWNEEAGASHAHTPLGQLNLTDDGCWINDTARICVTVANANASATGTAAPFGAWDCGQVMQFELDADTYTVNGKPSTVASIEQISDGAYGVTLSDGYRFAMFDVTQDSLTWHSPESGDTFDCRREK